MEIIMIDVVKYILIITYNKSVLSCEYEGNNKSSNESVSSCESEVNNDNLKIWIDVEKQQVF